MHQTKLRNTLLGFIDSAEGDLESVQGRIERWFDDTMDRASGWYKRTAQELIFGGGLVLCLALNADTFQIAKELSSNEALRNAVVTQATERVREGKSMNPPDNSASIEFRVSFAKSEKIFARRSLCRSAGITNPTVRLCVLGLRMKR